MVLPLSDETTPERKSLKTEEMIWSCISVAMD